MLDFYEDKGRKIFIIAIVILLVIFSFMLIANRFISFNKEVSQTNDVVEDVESVSTEQMMNNKVYSGQIEYVEGDVEKRSDANGGWFTAQKSDIIKNGDEVRTLAMGRAIVTFEDGSAVRLDENTHIIFESKGENITVDMDKGFVYNKVAKNDRRIYEVKTDDYTVTALGTEFSVENDGKRVDVMVVESAVDVKGSDDKVIDKIDEGNKAKITGGTVEKEKIVQKDLENDFIAWNIDSKNGSFSPKTTVDKVEKNDEKDDDDKYTDESIKLSGEKSSSGVRLHWDVKNMNTGHGFKVVKSKEINPVYPSDDYKYLSDANVRDYKWKIDTGKKYHFRVCAYQENGKCGMYSNDIYLDTPSNYDSDKDDEYAKEVSLSAEADGDDVKLKWDISGGDAPKGFKVVKSKSKNPVYPGDDYKYLSDSDTRKYEWKNLKEGKTYYFRVCIYKGGKCDTYSNNAKVSL